MVSNVIWFTVKEKKWKVDLFGKFYWTDKEELWDSDNCIINFARTIKDKCLIVVHSSQIKYSSFMEKDVKLRYMLAFEISVKPLAPTTEIYTARNNFPERTEGPKLRWVLQLDDKHWIWEWADDNKDIIDSVVYDLYNSLINELENPTIIGDNIIRAPVDEIDDTLIPVVYQPSIDALKNFVREIHYAKGPISPDGSYALEVSILFNNERLRQHGILNSIYEVIRRLLYGRVMDLESFKILVGKDSANERFVFEGIYSSNFEMNADSIHGDRTPPPAPEHSIRYFFINRNHPVVFINTSNHAMAEYDTNDRIWKWEYIPWMPDAPIKLGTMTRKQIEENIKNKSKT